MLKCFETLRLFSTIINNGNIMKNIIRLYTRRIGNVIVLVSSISISAT